MKDKKLDVEVIFNKKGKYKLSINYLDLNSNKENSYSEDLAYYPDRLSPANDSTEVGKLIIFNSVTDTAAIGVVSRNDVVGVNPTTWTAKADTVPAEYQLGMAKYNANRDSVLILPCPTRTYLYKHTTVCPDLDPEMVFVPAFKDMFPKGNLHFADSWLFAGNVKKNMECRLRHFGQQVPTDSNTQ